MKNKYIKLFIGVAFWLIVWQIFSFAIGKEVLLPSPITTVKTLVSFWGKADFWQSTAFSLLRICSGFLLGMVFGVVGAVLCSKFKIVDILTTPALKVVRAAPVASFIILAFVWIKVDAVPTFIAFLMVLPVVWTNVRQSISRLDKNLLEMAKVFKISRKKQLFNIIIPDCLPSFIASCITGLGFAWKSGVAAEVICRPPNALGSLLYNAKANIETPQVMALTVTIIIISAALESAMRRLARRWENGKL